MTIIEKPSPNFTAGRGAFKPEIVVLHIMAGTLLGTDDWFSRPISQVSAQYGVGKTGEIHRYVQEANQAWHAGVVLNPSFKLYKPGVNPNAYSIGIEHEGNDLFIEGTTAQLAASAALIADICKRWNIPIDRDHIIGHYQVTTGKPNCPAVNKTIVDTLVHMAAAGSAPVQSSPSPTLQDGIAQIEAGLAIVKAHS